VRGGSALVQGVDGEAIRNEVESIVGAKLTAEASGAVIQVLDEADVEAVLRITRKAGGHLASIQTVKQSLEELFVKETAE